MGPDIKTYRIQSHGVDSGQCFPGASIVLTSFEYVVTGTGKTEAEAYGDAVEQIAWGYTDDLVELLELPKFWGDDEQTVCENCGCDVEIEDCEADCKQNYHVSVYFNVEE